MIPENSKGSQDISRTSTPTFDHDTNCRSLGCCRSLSDSNRCLERACGFLTVIYAHLAQVRLRRSLDAAVDSTVPPSARHLSVVVSTTPVTRLALRAPRSRLRGFIAPLCHLRGKGVRTAPRHCVLHALCDTISTDHGRLNRLRMEAHTNKNNNTVSRRRQKDTTYQS